MDRKDYYFRQKVTEAELDAGFDDVEAALWNFAFDVDLLGIAQGLLVTEYSTPNLTVNVGPGSAYDYAGQRVRVPGVQNVDVSVDYLSVSTSVINPGYSKIVSVSVKFTRALSDPRTDGNSVTVYFERQESFEFVVRQGAETGGTPTPPSIPSDEVLLADITRTYGDTTINNVDIDLEGRREDTFAVDTGTLQLRAGTTKEAITALQNLLEGHVTGGGATHPATSVNYAGGPAWADTTANPATNVEAQLDKIVSDLVGTQGTAKINGHAASGTTYSLTNARLDQQLEALLGFVNTVQTNLDLHETDISSTASGDDGALSIGAQAQTGVNGIDFSVGSVRSQLDALLLWIGGLKSTTLDGSTFIGAKVSGNYPAGTVRSQLDLAKTWIEQTTRVYYVDRGAASAGSTGSASKPFQENSTAMSAAGSSGETDFLVIVAPGSYVGFTIPAGKNFSFVGAGRRLVSVSSPTNWYINGGENLHLRGITFNAVFSVFGTSIDTMTSIVCESCSFEPASGIGFSLYNYTSDPGGHYFKAAFVGDSTPLEGAISAAEACILRGYEGGDADETLVRVTNMLVDNNVDAHNCASFGCFWYSCVLNPEATGNAYLYQTRTSGLDVVFSAPPGPVFCDEFTNYWLKASGSHVNITKTIQEDPTP